MRSAIGQEIQFASENYYYIIESCGWIVEFPVTFTVSDRKIDTYR